MFEIYCKVDDGGLIEDKLVCLEWLDIVLPPNDDKCTHFAIALTSFCLLWINTFNDPEQQKITNRELDLRDWDFSDGQSITLAGG